MKSLIFFACFVMCSALSFAQQGSLIAYANTPGALPSKQYSLMVNNRPVFVEQFKDISYARFAMDGPVNIVVTSGQAFTSFHLSPLHYAIPTFKENNQIRFQLNKPRKLILQLEGVSEKLFIFADAPEKNVPDLHSKQVLNLLDFVQDKEGKTLQTTQLQKAIDAASQARKTLYVPNGTYLTGTFVMRKDVNLYLESGALIQGSGSLPDYHDNGDNSSGKVMRGRGALIYFDKADNARITGRGTIAMQGTKIMRETGQKVRTCNMRSCHHAGIEDIVLRDAGGFNIHMLNCTDMMMKGYKIINDISLPNQDGTDPDGCDGVVVDDVFMYTSDDAIAVKADHSLCQHVLVKNCVFWTVKSALKVGSDPYFDARHIVFQNNDVVYADRALALYAGKGTIEDVQFIDNRSEFVGGNAKRQLIVFQVSNAKENAEDPERRGIGSISHVQVINYTAYQQSQNKSLISGTIGKDGSIHRVSDVVFKNLVIEGKKCLSAEAAGIVVRPMELPQDPNIPAKDLAKRKSEITLTTPLDAVENIVFE